MWIHEGWTTYLESLYVEYTFGYADALKYVNGYKTQGRKTASRSSRRAASTRTPPQDMYFKGALFLNTLRSVVNDDARWFKLLHDIFQHFKYQNIMTEDIVQFFNAAARPEPDADLRSVPAAHGAAGAGARSSTRPRARSRIAGRPTSAAFAMPIRVGERGAWQIDPADDRLEDDEDAAEEGRVRGRDRSLLRERHETVGGGCRIRPCRRLTGIRSLQ